MNPETECSLIEQRDYIIEEEEDRINGEKKMEESKNRVEVKKCDKPWQRQTHQICPKGSNEGGGQGDIWLGGCRFAFGIQTTFHIRFEGCGSPLSDHQKDIIPFHADVAHCFAARCLTFYSQ